jgi:hypothetical protein
MLKAIDSQQVIIQTEQANRVQQVDRQHPEMQQRFLDMEARQEKKLLHRAITSSHEAEHAAIRDENQKERENNSPQGRRAKDSEGSEQNSEEDGEESAGGHINIRV